MSAAQLDIFSALTLAARSKRDRVLRAVEGSHSSYVDGLRTIAREIARERGTVCIDDVRVAMRARGVPMPDAVGITARVFGTIFCRREFRPIGQRLTSREERVARSGKGSSYICVYELVENAR